MNCIKRIIFKNQLSKYEGKVREVYTLKNDIMIMIASDRISAFDVVMPRGITFKGQVLNQIAVEMLNRTKDIVQNWLIENPDPNFVFKNDPNYQAIQLFDGDLNNDSILNINDVIFLIGVF